MLFFFRIGKTADQLIFFQFPEILIQYFAGDLPPEFQYGIETDTAFVIDCHEDIRLPFSADHLEEMTIGKFTFLNF